jgi:hypothetical protein
MTAQMPHERQCAELSQRSPRHQWRSLRTNLRQYHERKRVPPEGVELESQKTTLSQRSLLLLRPTQYRLVQHSPLLLMAECC